jgi:hypothetical protein
VRRCLQEGEEIHQTVSLVNQNKQEVHGITPLYLASHHTAGFRAVGIGGLSSRLRAKKKWYQRMPRHAQAAPLFGSGELKAEGEKLAQDWRLEN